RDQPGREPNGTRDRDKARVARGGLDEFGFRGSRGLSTRNRADIVRSHAGLPMRSGRAKGERTMKWATVLFFLLMVLAPVLRVVAAAPLDGASTAKRMEVRVETLANLESGSVESCEAIQTKSASAALSFAFWSTLGEAGSAESESSGKA